MPDFNLQPVAESIKAAIENSSERYAEVSIGIIAYFGMTLGFEHQLDDQTLSRAIAAEANRQIQGYLDGEAAFLSVADLEYLAINGDEEALTKLPKPGQSQLSKFPTVVQFVPAFKALVRVNAAESRLLINENAPAAQKFVPASSDPDAAKNEWQTKMQKVVTTTIEQLGIKPPDSIEDWQDQLLDLLAEAQLAWPESEDDADPQMFTNHYKCPDCGHEWTDEGTATCDDDCPACGKRHISPAHSE